MKSMTTKLMLTAAALAIATGVASAQTYRAEIPFSFQAGGKTMPSGDYTVKMTDGNRRIVVFANYDSNTAAVLMSLPGPDSKKASPANGGSVLGFDCGVGRCALATLRTGSTEPVLTFPHRKVGNDEHASLTEIRLVKANGE